MPWRCPACSAQVRHGEAETMPRLGTLYRCPVCRLELVLDPKTQKMQIAPLDGVDDERKSKK